MLLRWQRGNIWQALLWSIQLTFFVFPSMLLHSSATISYGLRWGVLVCPRCMLIRQSARLYQTEVWMRVFVISPMCRHGLAVDGFQKETAPGSSNLGDVHQPQTYRVRSLQSPKSSLQ